MSAASFGLVKAKNTWTQRFLSFFEKSELIPILASLSLSSGRTALCSSEARLDTAHCEQRSSQPPRATSCERGQQLHLSAIQQLQQALKNKIL